MRARGAASMDLEIFAAKRQANSYESRPPATGSMSCCCLSQVPALSKNPQEIKSLKMTAQENLSVLVADNFLVQTTTEIISL